MAIFGAINWLGLIFFIVVAISVYSMTFLFFGKNARRIFNEWIKKSGGFTFPVWALYLGWALAFGFIIPSGYLAWARRIDHETVGGEIVIVDNVTVKSGFYYAGLVLYFVSIVSTAAWVPAVFYKMSSINPDMKATTRIQQKIKNGLFVGIALLVIGFCTGVVADVFFFIVWSVPGGLFIPYLVWICTLFVLSLLMVEGTSQIKGTESSESSPMVPPSETPADDWEGV